MKRIAPLVAFTVLLASTDALAQAWIRPAGEVYVNTSYSRISGDGFYGPDKERVELGSTYSQSALGLYAEAGLIDRWLMLSLDGELFRQNTLEGQGETTGLGDLRVGAWTGLVEAGAFRLSAGLLVGLPTGDDQPQADGDDPSADDIATLLPTGDGEIDIEPRLIAGYSFGGGGWTLAHYLVAEAGYWIRNEGISDGITYRLELGTQVARKHIDRVWLIGRFYGLESLASDEEAGRGFSGLGQGVTHTSLGADVYVRVWDTLGVSTGLATAVRARNIISAAPFRATISYTF